jgi:hypothetical protein
MRKTSARGLHRSNYHSSLAPFLLQRFVPVLFTFEELNDFGIVWIPFGNEIVSISVDHVDREVESSSHAVKTDGTRDAGRSLALVTSLQPTDNPMTTQKRNTEPPS